MSPRVQLDGRVGITAGSGSVRAVHELEIDVFFMNLKPARITASNTIKMIKFDLTGHQGDVEGQVGEDGDGDDEGEPQQPPGDGVEDQDPAGTRHFSLHLLKYHRQPARYRQPRRRILSLTDSLYCVGFML